MAKIEARDRTDLMSETSFHGSSNGSRVPKNEFLRLEAQEGNIQDLLRPALVSFPFEVIKGTVNFINVDHHQREQSVYEEMCAANGVIPYFKVRYEYNSDRTMFTPTHKFYPVASFKTEEEIRLEVERAQENGLRPNSRSYVVNCENDYNKFCHEMLILPFDPPYGSLDDYSIENSHLFFTSKETQNSQALIKLEDTSIRIIGATTKTRTIAREWIMGLLKFQF